MRGDGGGAGKLGIAVHPAHGVGQAIGGRTRRHVIGVQGTAGAAAAGHGEVLHAVLPAPLLVGAGHGVLEAGRIGRVAGDGNIHLLHLHNGYALQYIVAAVALDLGALALAKDDLAHHLYFAGSKVKVSFYIGKAVHPADDIGSVLAQTVQDDPQRFLAGLVGVAGNADGAFRRRKGLMPRQEAEALGLIAQQHSTQVAVAQAHLALLGNGTGHAEGL